MGGRRIAAAMLPAEANILLLAGRLKPKHGTLVFRAATRKHGRDQIRGPPVCVPGTKEDIGDVGRTDDGSRSPIFLRVIHHLSDIDDGTCSTARRGYG